MTCLDDSQRFRAIRRFQRDVTQRAQLRQHRVSHQLVVFHDKNGLVSAWNGWPGSGLGSQRGARTRRQVNLDGGAVALLAVDLDVPRGLLHETVDHAQAEASTFSRLLRRKERVE